MSKLGFLTKEGIKKKLSSKWFLVVNILLLLVIVAATNFDTIITYFGGDFDKETKIYIVDEVGVFDNFELIMKEGYTDILSSSNLSLIKSDKTEEELSKELKENEESDIIINITPSENTFNAKITSYDYIDTILYQTLINALNSTKISSALANSNINQEELAKIYTSVEVERILLNEELKEDQEFMTFVGGIVVIVLILPLFFLIIMLVQMIGAEINEEKTSRSMEIIISSVSPEKHFASKIIASNIFVLAQGLLFLIYLFIGLFVRVVALKVPIAEVLSGNEQVGDMLVQLLQSDILSSFVSAIPFLGIMFVLTFIAYSLLSGVLASMTTSMEDFQQLQTPTMLVLVAGYYLALSASFYHGALIIKIISYIPYISGILAPVLYILGQTTIIDLFISIALLVIINVLLIKYGMKVYKVGILNYSSKKLWKKIFKAVKE